MKNKVYIFIIVFILIFSTTLDSASTKNKSYSNVKMFKLIKSLGLFSPRIILRNEKLLKLSLKQIEQIEREILSHEKFIIKNRAEIKMLELELVFLLSQEPVNRKMITEKLRSNGKLKTESFLKHLKHLFKIKDILSEKQIGVLVQNLKT